MKKTLLSFAVAMTALSSSAQTVLWDGDNTNENWWDDGSPALVDNPDKTGINPSEKCMKFTMKSDSKVVKVPFREWVKPSMNGSKRISIMIKKTKNTNVNIEVSDPTDGSQGYWQKAAAWYGSEGAWQKLVFDFSTHSEFDNPGVMTITASTDDVDGDEDVYIDNIMIEEAPKVNDNLLSSYAENALSGDLKLTGAWMKGECQNTNGNWQKVSYDDYAALNKACSTGVTSIDAEGAELYDADVNMMAQKNTNMLIYTKNNYEGANVVVLKDGERTAGVITISDADNFACPIEFTATEVKVKRSMVANWNTVCLPFAVSKSELNAKKVGKFVNVNNSVVNFTAVDEAEAYQPVIVKRTEAVENETGLTFTNKKFVKTPESLGETFIGTMAKKSATGLYGITSDGKFAKGGEQATIGAFRAYISLPEAQIESLRIDGMDEESGVTEVKADGSQVADIVTLNGAVVKRNATAADFNGLKSGIYLFANQKVVVK